MAEKLDKKLVKEGNGKDYPKRGDQVAMNYTGWLFDANADQNRGAQSASLALAMTELY
jgi:FK506-binding protein 1